MAVSLTEMAAATATLLSLPRPKRIQLSPSAARAVKDIAVLRGSVPDQPDQNSIIDGYLATLARAQLTGAPAALGHKQQPAASSQPSDQVRNLLMLSLAAGDPPHVQDVISSADAALRRTKDPIGQITVATAASLALARAENPCSMVDRHASRLKTALADVVARPHLRSDAVRAWLTLLWSTTEQCTAFQRSTQPESSAFLATVTTERAAPNPTSRAVHAWTVAELHYVTGHTGGSRHGIALRSFTDAEPGEGLGLGVFAALRARELAGPSCPAGLNTKLRG